MGKVLFALGVMAVFLVAFNGMNESEKVSAMDKEYPGSIWAGDVPGVKRATFALG